MSNRKKIEIYEDDYNFLLCLEIWAIVIQSLGIEDWEKYDLAVKIYSNMVRKDNRFLRLG